MHNLRSCLNHSLKVVVFSSLMTSFFLKVLLNSCVLAISFSRLTACQYSYYPKVPEPCISFDRPENSIKNDCFKQTFETSNKNHTEFFCRIHTMKPPDVKRCYEPTPKNKLLFLTKHLHLNDIWKLIKLILNKCSIEIERKISSSLY